MIHTDLTPPPLAAFAANTIRVLLRAMAPHTSDADLKACVMLAREHGHLTDEDAEFYIAAWGLKEA